MATQSRLLRSVSVPAAEVVALNGAIATIETPWDSHDLVDELGIGPLLRVEQSSRRRRRCPL